MHVRCDCDTRALLSIVCTLSSCPALVATDAKESVQPLKKPTPHPLLLLRQQRKSCPTLFFVRGLSVLVVRSKSSLFDY